MQVKRIKLYSAKRNRNTIEASEPYTDFQDLCSSLISKAIEFKQRRLRKQAEEIAEHYSSKGDSRQEDQTVLHLKHQNQANDPRRNKQIDIATINHYVTNHLRLNVPYFFIEQM